MIHIVGLGGVGFWMTVGLCRSVHPSDLTGWDDDTLDGGNGALRLPNAAPATSKVDLLRGFLLVAMGEMGVPTLHKARFSGQKGVTPGDLVVDCTDMALRNRRMMWTYAQKNGARVLRASYDGKASVVLVSTGLPLMAPEAGGYAEIPTLALSLAAGGLAAEAVRRFIIKPVPHFDLALAVGEVIP